MQNLWPDPGTLPTGLDIALKLVVVLALIYLTAALARRYLLKVPVTGRGLVRVLEASPIAPRKAIYVVEVGGRVLVLGATETTMTTLAEITDAETVASLTERAKPGPGFQRYLEQSLGQNGRPLPAIEAPMHQLAAAVARLRHGRSPSTSTQKGEDPP